MKQHADAQLDALLRDGNKAVTITANLEGWVRSHCRRGKGQCLALGVNYVDLRGRGADAVELLRYALVDAEGPADDVDSLEAKYPTDLAKRNAEAEIDSFKGHLHLKGFRIAGVDRDYDPDLALDQGAGLV